VTGLDYEPVAERPGPSQTVAGLLSSLAIFTSLIALAWHPLRLLPPAIIIALIAAGMVGPHNRLARAAVMICAVCFFLGMTIAVVTSRALW
jgi:predicted membrane protein